MTIPGLPTGGPFGEQEWVYNDKYLATEIGQIGTQFDGPAHIGVITTEGEFFYNGRFLHDDVKAMIERQLSQEHTLIIVTHNSKSVERCQRKLMVKKGAAVWST